MEDEYTILSMEAQEYDGEVQNLEKERKGMKKEVDRLTSEMATIKKTLPLHQGKYDMSSMSPSVYWFVVWFKMEVHNVNTCQGQCKTKMCT